MQNPFFLLPYVPKSICSEAPVMDSSAVVNSSNMAASLLPDLCPATWALLLHDLCDDIGPSSLLQRSFPSQALSWSSRCVLKQHKASANNRNVTNLILLFLGGVHFTVFEARRPKTGISMADVFRALLGR